MNSIVTERYDSYKSNPDHKPSYQEYLAGERVILNVSGDHDGHHIDKGHEFTIIEFPHKVRLIPGNDVNKKGSYRSRFILGITDEGWWRISGRNVIYCTYPDYAKSGWHEKNIVNWLREIDTQVELWGRANKPQQYRDNIRKIKNSIDKYCVALGYKLPKKTLKAISHEELAKRAVAARVLHLAKVQETKEANKEFRLQVRKGKKDMLIWNDLWRAYREAEFGTVGEYADCSHHSITVYEGDLPQNHSRHLLLRTDGNVIEMSNGEECTIQEFIESYQNYKWMVANRELLDSENGPEASFELFGKSITTFNGVDILFDQGSSYRNNHFINIASTEMDAIYNKLQALNKVAV